MDSPTRTLQRLKDDSRLSGLGESLRISQRFRLGTISSSDIVEIHLKKTCGGDLVLTQKRGLGNMPIWDDFFQEAIRGLKKFNTDQREEVGLAASANGVGLVESRGK